MLHNSASGSGQGETPATGEGGKTLGRRRRSDSSTDENNLSSAPRKRPPLPLIKEGLDRHIQLQAGIITESELSDQDRREHRIFKELLKLSPGLELRVVKSSAEELHYIADSLHKGSSGARADDTKSLKSAIVDWITPNGGALSPPLSRNVKTDRGFHHYATGELLCPATLDWSDEKIRQQLRSGEIACSGEAWPAFLYRDSKFNPENPWDGLFQGKLLVSAFKHIFTSPSSVDSESRATRAGNAELHGMKSVRFALTATAVFSRNDRATDSERFYSSILEFLEDPDEVEEVTSLLKWWNVKIFPVYHSGADSGKVAIPSVCGAVKEWRKAQARAALGEKDPNAMPHPSA
ncbi:hypothetical protein NMY22_g4686 [Coprinellus aureogranulatus]|nr:hypothetical protein NMY22_g4686 [Coprinellus aureogranulatus]